MPCFPALCLLGKSSRRGGDKRERKDNLRSKIELALG
jgi:hypothetical protein